ncbi:MAG: phosphoglucosamine mutase [Acidimicrobiales bacterium]|nr:phosphoglucosamine mutase [Acidimicrobiales bacterium]
MTLRFGTDGVRAHADELTPEFTARLGQAAARVLGGPRLVVGMDTRASGPSIAAALAGGVQAEGVEVDLLGVVPTPAVACLSARDGVPGAVISASHNSWHDNGIKFFAPGGRKLRDDVEARLEAELDALVHGATPVPAPVELDGRDVAAVEAYEQAVLGALEGRDLRGLSVVVDCANGAASAVAPDVLRRLGAEVHVIHAEPDGRNINDGCGSTHPGDLQAAVVSTGAALGLAFDGDADRLLAVDEHGSLVDGDQLIAMCALDLRARRLLPDDTVVVTVMTNLGFKLAMRDAGITVVETAVGDRYVLEALEDGGWGLGGEQSGHIIFRQRATTGDGLLTAVSVADLVQRSGAPLSVHAAVMQRLPQVLVNVRVAERDPAIAELIAPAIAAEEAALGETGRVLIRPSGTEPLVRVMVEAPTAELAAAAADRLAAAVEAVAGGSAG